MSKVQVDTIVDKDDISAPSLTKGAIVTGVCTATSFDGAISEWVLGANGSSDYTFTGSGLTGAENDPTLYLKRGQKYRFKNSSGGHPFRIQSTANGSAGTAYNDGVTNNDAGDGTTLEWDVQFDAPDVLYYQCTAHGSMGGKIYIGNSGNSSTLVDLNVSGVTTTGIATVTTSVVVGSAVTANADGVITAGVGTFGSVVSTGQLSLNGIGSGDIVSELTTDSPTFTYRNGSGAWFHAGKHPTADAFIVADGATTTTNERVRIDSSGKIGINTDLPGSKVTIADNSAAAQVELKRLNTNTTGAVGAINWTAMDGHSVANMYALGDGDNEGAHLVFKTTTAAASNDPFDASTVERLRIGSQGEIGIAGANYGTSGQVLTSGGSGAAVSWATPSGGLSEYDQWQCTDNTQSNEAVWAFDVIGSSNPSGGPVTLARVTTSQNPRFAKIGTGMSYSAGIWTFPSTGYWEVIMSAQLYTTSNATRNFRLETTENNSTYTETCRAQMYGTTYSSHTHNWINYFNITDVSNQKIRYLLDSSGSSCAWYGANNMTRTNWIFKKVG